VRRRDGGWVAGAGEPTRSRGQRGRVHPSAHMNFRRHFRREGARGYGRAGSPAEGVRVCKNVEVRCEFFRRAFSEPLSVGFAVAL